jgi:hypothetical protein
VECKKSVAIEWRKGRYIGAIEMVTLATKRAFAKKNTLLGILPSSVFQKTLPAMTKNKECRRCLRHPGILGYVFH